MIEQAFSSPPQAAAPQTIKKAVTLPASAKKVTGGEGPFASSSISPKLTVTSTHLGYPSMKPDQHKKTARQLASDYTVLPKPIGHGASGIVFRATHKKTHRVVAVKSCSLVANASPTAHEQLLTSMEVHSSLDHKHIIKLEDTYMSSTRVHMVMEFLGGGSLGEALAKRGRFNEEDTKAVLRQVLEAVDYMHKLNIAHRDIKLENIMFETHSNMIKLIDLGFATEWDGISKMSIQCGTVGFSAPELLRGAYTDKVDMWSVGVVTYMLLTGEATEMYVLSERLLECSREARDFVRSLLVRDPAWRLSAAGALSHPWLDVPPS